MRAVRQHEFGAPDVLHLEEVPDPEPAAGEVRIAVEAAGVHLVDTALRAGVPRGPVPLPALPATPGREVAGRVDRVGPGVPGGWVGARVVAHLGPAGSGGYAALAVAPEAALHPVPDGLDAAAAVALVGTGRMAVGLLEVGRPAAGDVVLVTSAAGGIGTLLVQAARAAGAVVVGAAGGPAKVARVRAAGADVAVDYRDPGWAGAVAAALGDERVTLAFDGVGGAVGAGVLGLLAPGGRLVLHGWSGGRPALPGPDEVLERGLSVAVALGPRITRLPGGLRGLEERALADAAAGRWAPAVQAFPLAEAAAAHAALEDRRTTGKVVLVP